MEIVAELEKAGVHVAEVITSGTPAFPCALSYPRFQGASFIHRISPGTVVYSDATSAAQLSKTYGYKPAAIVISRVVSHPRPGLITCDAGHKAVAADAGLPTCTVAGRPDLIPLKPSEEHLPIEVPPGAPVPALGEALYLIPRHVCPTVNNFNFALMVRGGRVENIETRLPRMISRNAAPCRRRCYTPLKLLLPGDRENFGSLYRSPSVSFVQLSLLHCCIDA